ncbi:hypothetical protein Pint_04925 [Pistacia integerrima]|uniref:Uncharacterized protein n=1 Tax=Pistacia integerrima TaxID=434235 RepID=A0ACC0Z4S5_9ROSI|nr:hypothetical protein Pint_04925 [Pistacia integerrima]
MKYLWFNIEKIFYHFFTDRQAGSIITIPFFINSVKVKSFLNHQIIQTHFSLLNIGYSNFSWIYQSK